MVRRKSVNSRRKKRKQRTYKGGIPVLSRLSRNRQERQIKNYNNNKDAREAQERKNMKNAIEAAEVGKRNEIRQLLYDDTIGSNKLKNAASAEAREKDKIFFENHGLKYKPDKNVDNLRKSLERESKQQLKTLESLKEIELQKKKQSEKQFSNEQRSTIAQLDRTKNKLDYEIKEMKKKPITTEEFCDVDGNKLSSSCKKLDGLNNDLNKTTASKTQLTQPEKDYVEGKMNAAEKQRMDRTRMERQQAAALHAIKQKQDDVNQRLRQGKTLEDFLKHPDTTALDVGSGGDAGFSNEQIAAAAAAREAEQEAAAARAREAEQEAAAAAEQEAADAVAKANAEQEAVEAADNENADNEEEDPWNEKDPWDVVGGSKRTKRKPKTNKKSRKKKPRKSVKNKRKTKRNIRKTLRKR